MNKNTLEQKNGNKNCVREQMTKKYRKKTKQRQREWGEQANNENSTNKTKYEFFLSL